MYLFLATILVLTLLLPWTASFFFSHGWLHELPSFLYPSTWLMAFVTTIIFLYLYRAGKEAHFVQLYLLSMVVKLIACLAFVLMMVLEDRQGAMTNATYFLIIYVIFTAAEIGFLHRKISASRRR